MHSRKYLCRVPSVKLSSMRSAIRSARFKAWPRERSKCRLHHARCCKMFPVHSSAHAQACAQTHTRTHARVLSPSHLHSDMHASCCTCTSTQTHTYMHTYERTCAQVSMDSRIRSCQLCAWYHVDSHDLPFSTGMHGPCTNTVGTNSTDRTRDVSSRMHCLEPRIWE